MSVGLSRVTADNAGGTIASGSPNVFINGFPAARHGDSVTSHGAGAHVAATLISVTRGLFINGLRAVAAGDSATCGHVATGSPTVTVGI